MYEQLSVMTRKGQVTIPAAIRHALKLKEGDKLSFSLENRADGQIVLRPIRSVAEMTAGAIRPRWRPDDLRALREAAWDEVAEAALAETPGESDPTP
jgi:AbrB family looped-hinge helix DNA binding protein